ncbi:PspC domain-containing protein [Arthrobacter sp. I2-34]|uniref:PspC domain-containing protein n=1 Tax=Arthrobacter hankyongi TaxID=2904801 RepID=A0ABS9L4F2_9MICC|nr:PspC domain-containing protein [Arthrobacter hankyongi]MCG2621536.1 PspC domain-containing protein [Arthrobacter hankyongi]
MDSLYKFLRSIPLRRGPDRWVAGICGGIAAKFGWDPTLVRIGTLLLFLLPGLGLGAYLVVWLLLPWHDGSIALERMVSAGRRSIR